jgi:hypothetical protein
MAEHTGLRSVGIMPNADASHLFGTLNIEGRNSRSLIMPSKGSRIIRNTYGERLLLTPERLTQIDSQTNTRYFATGKDICSAHRYHRTDIQIYPKRGGKSTGLSVRFTSSSPFNWYQIGCCSFDEATWKLILKTVRARKPLARAAKAGN